MPKNDQYIPRGWLHKSCRFSLMQLLKLRYFVLLDTELRYYKHPDDTHPVGIIELKYFQSVQVHNTASLYGFRIVSESKGQWIPMLYADTKEERHLWIDRIQANLNRLSAYTQYCSSSICSIHSHSIAERSEVTSLDTSYTQDYHSVLDKWLHKLDLYDGRDKEIIVDSGGRRYSNQLRSNSIMNPFTSSSTIIGSPTSIKNRSFESFLPATDNNGGYYLIDNNSSSVIISPSNTPTRNLSRQSSSSKKSLHNNTIEHKLSLESEREIYTEHTTHRSTSNIFHSELVIIPLSPPPPRR